MKIDVMTSENHPIHPHLQDWAKARETDNTVRITTQKLDLDGGDVLFLISCTEMISAAIRNRYAHTLVVHASDLPQGKGWSPHIWGILEGKGEIVVSLFEAVDRVDAGDIWRKEKMIFGGHELYDEINRKLFGTTLKLMDFALDNKDTVKPMQQNNKDETFYKKRSPADSQIDPDKSIAEQFNLLRVCDPNRFPAFFELAGHKYRIILEKID